jgi:UDP-glucose:(heptosyl)LPS alpha-1,3-glucosyltransferase
MKVALVHMRSSWTGGTERYLVQIATELVRRNHETTVVCRSHRGESVAGARYQFLRGPTVGAAMRMRSFARAVERHVAVADYDVVVGLGKTWTHDVVRLGGGSHASYLELAHDWTRTPLERILGLDRWKQSTALAIERRALAPGAYRQVIANSEMVRRDVGRRYGVSTDLVSVIRNGVDLVRFERGSLAARALQLRRELAIEERDPVVLFLGTGYGRKGLSLALYAAAPVLARHERAHLVVAGFDSGEKAYRRQAERLGIAARTRFIGGRRDTECVYAAADVYVLPTRYDPFASTTLEALACGLPVVTSDTNGAGELITTGVEGDVISVDAGEEVWTAAIEEWLGRAGDVRTAARGLAEGYPQEKTARLSAELVEGLGGRG